MSDHTASLEDSASNIIKQGWLLKQSRYIQDWRRRWIVLTDKSIDSYKNPAAVISNQPTESLPLSQCSTVKSVEGLTYKHAFRVDTPERVFLLVGASVAEKEAWIGAIGKQMIHTGLSNVYTEEDVVY
ncbi:PH domain protein [Gregarina niphandrodes]|uniref:PH domain protein n=1 Tax=Gregarina niphandrodes TaxID=110365 RepID=A0A023B366_GRENI|nr:PH domain protein [Gregarina niphandrodes]EZG55329.1 PH domain protein [Gregarina niphandrodes]|eukprot:XP_011131624.1 PH domain protein [Gregarina niphandrodes]